ncbi:putative ethanolamine kinase [Tothia fuscella]|uniref:ethanolamine kinase n=1 Tax=Tothia fuscella TaxID=1048955 RepID=A0A9P4TVV7_9PEZI|nr:putative ethanolamine kinase [Tothia fuscella]
MAEHIRLIDLYYDNAESHDSALALILALRPEWEETKESVEFVRFKDGITNTLFKAINNLPGLSEYEIDQEAVLLRAYGRGTQVLIDRDCEATSHSVLANYKLAPPLLARFNNGLLYKYIAGKVCSPEDLRRPEIWRGVARRIAEYHATLPISAVSAIRPDTANEIAPGKPSPNVWTVMQKWILALPTNTDEKKQRQTRLQSELEWLVKELGDTPGIGGRPLVFGHCDLLSGNVIVLPHSDSISESSTSSSPALSAASSELPFAPVSFIDYEYATPSPQAFDIANHFAEWGGFGCDFTKLPTRSQRHDFLSTYLNAYNGLLGRESDPQDFDQLFEEVDIFRGAPGFYWGIWALIQATISQIDFDYASYAEIRLSEYFDWKDALQGRAPGAEIPIREARWATEED